MANPYADENGVFKNKLGLTDAAELRHVEYLATANRARELSDGTVPIQQPGFGLARQQEIHRHIFQDVYEWAGQVRTVPSAKRMDNGQQSRFAEPDTIVSRWQTLEHQTAEFVSAKWLSFEQKRDALVAVFIEANQIHPFAEGNGRSLQVFMRQLAHEQGVGLDFTKVNPREWNHASAVSGQHGRLFEHVHFIAQPPDAQPIRKIFADIAQPIQDKVYVAHFKSAVPGPVEMNKAYQVDYSTQARDVGQPAAPSVPTRVPTTPIVEGAAGELSRAAASQADREPPSVRGSETVPKAPERTGYNLER